MNNLSIIIPYYNGEKQIKNCIEKILYSYKLSAQLIKFEIIVILDSMDDKKFIKEELEHLYSPIVILENDNNIGVAKSRNFGLSRSKYDYVVFIDQDDYFLSNYFSVLEQNINNDSSVYIFNGYVFDTKLDTKKIIFDSTPRFCFEYLIKKIIEIRTPGLLVFKKEITNKQFFTDPSEFKGADDWGAYLSLTLTYPDLKYKYIDEIVFCYVNHGENFSVNNKLIMYQSAIMTIKHLKLITTDKNYLEWMDKQILIFKFRIERKVNNKNSLRIAFEYPNVFKCFVSNYITRKYYSLKGKFNFPFRE